MKNRRPNEKNVPAKAALVFVYNANSGLFNALSDLARKTFAPETYACRLCALTYSTFGMRREWKDFLESLDRPLEFLHADELRAKHGVTDTPLPAVLLIEGGRARVLLAAAAINRCRTLDELKRLLLNEVP